MLQHPVHLQDENKGVHTAKPGPDAENSVPGKGRVVSKGLGAGGKAAGLSVQRKALGNITNTGLGGEARQAGKSVGLAPRKALGDITNATPRPTQPAAEAQKPAQPQAQAKKASTQSLADIYAEDGVERLAGKGWHEMEKDQQQKADADIAARVAAISAVPFRFPFASSSSRHRARRQPLQSIPAHQAAAEVPRPPTPPPTPQCSLDLDDLSLADALLLDAPKIDWSFGSMFTTDDAISGGRGGNGDTAARAGAD